MTQLQYKGYTADVAFDSEGGILFGQVRDIRGAITFQSESAAAIEGEFHTPVDEYLAFCARQEIEPARLYSGDRGQNCTVVRRFNRGACGG